MTSEELEHLLDEIDRPVQHYSGWGMMGRQCVAVALESMAELWIMAMQLGHNCEHHIPAPRTDSLGYGIIAYWPQYEVGKNRANSAR